MLFVTAKVSKKKIIYTIVVLVAAVAIIVFLPRVHSSVPSYTGLDTNEARISLLNEWGWQVQVEPTETQEVLIPAEFSDTYRQYNELQLQSGFNLEKYAGKTAMRYSYLIINYPDYNEPVYADMLIYNGELIGGDIHSLNLDGFMVSLRQAEQSN